MQKRRASLWIGLSVSLVALVIVACDDDAPSTFDEDRADAGGFDSGPGFVVDANVLDGRAPSCNPALDGFTPTWKPPTKAAVCDPAKLGEYYDACLSPKTSDAGTTCAAWTAANDACAKCIEPEDGSGPIQWHRGRYYFTLNVAGCLALTRNEPEPGECPATYGAAIDCQRAACNGCFETGSSSFADFQTCQRSAKGTACSSYDGKIGEVCGASYNDPDGGSFECFPNPDDANQKDHFVRVEALFCGK